MKNYIYIDNYKKFFTEKVWYLDNKMPHKKELLKLLQCKRKGLLTFTNEEFELKKEEISALADKEWEEFYKNTEKLNKKYLDKFNYKLTKEDLLFEEIGAYIGAFYKLKDGVSYYKDELKKTKKSFGYEEILKETLQKISDLKEDLLNVINKNKGILEKYAEWQEMDIKEILDIKEEILNFKD